MSLGNLCTARRRPEHSGRDKRRSVVPLFPTIRRKAVGKNGINVLRHKSAGEGSGGFPKLHSKGWREHSARWIFHANRWREHSEGKDQAGKCLKISNLNFARRHAKRLRKHPAEILWIVETDRIGHLTHVFFLTQQQFLRLVEP